MKRFIFSLLFTMFALFMGSPHNLAASNPYQKDRTEIAVHQEKQIIYLFSETHGTCKFITENENPVSVLSKISSSANLHFMGIKSLSLNYFKANDLITYNYKNKNINPTNTNKPNVRLNIRV